jgi:hypothetical protein
VERWTGAWGPHTWTVAGQGVPYQPTTFEAAVVGGPSSEARLELTGGDLSVDLSPPMLALPVGAPTANFEIRSSGSCPVEGQWWRVSTGAGVTRGVAHDRFEPVVLPAHPPGLHPVWVELHGPDAVGLRPSTLLRQLRIGEPPAPFAALDVDGDGAEDHIDCDDHDPQVSPREAERTTPNGRDDNCDGRVDEGTTAYDDDGDGLTEDEGDCNDLDARVRPGADEIADCRDNDCDGRIDQGLAVAPLADDPYEAPDGQPHRVIAQVRWLEMPLPLVSRDLQDEERIRFWSQDGTFDEWGIDVVASRLPAGSSYRVRILRGVAEVGRGTLEADGDRLRVTGSPWRDETGDYELVVEPVTLPTDGCPVELYLEAR